MIPNPSWPEAFFCVLVLTLPCFEHSLPRASGILASNVVILLGNADFRGTVINWVKTALVIISLSGSFMLATRVGQHQIPVLTLEWQALRLIHLLSGLLAGFITICFWDATTLLDSLDRIKVSRKISYVLLGTMDSLEEARRQGERQTRLLTLKRISRSPIDRFRAYYRIVLPMFIILLKRQLTHAESLEQRGFFAPPAKPQPQTRLNYRTLSLPALLLVNFLLWQAADR